MAPPRRRQSPRVRHRGYHPTEQNRGSSARVGWLGHWRRRPRAAGRRRPRRRSFRGHTRSNDARGATIRSSLFLGSARPSAKSSAGSSVSPRAGIRRASRGISSRSIPKPVSKAAPRSSSSPAYETATATASRKCFSARSHLKGSGHKCASLAKALFCRTTPCFRSLSKPWVSARCASRHSRFSRTTSVNSCNRTSWMARTSLNAWDVIYPVTMELMSPRGQIVQHLTNAEPVGRFLCLHDANRGGRTNRYLDCAGTARRRHVHENAPYRDGDAQPSQSRSRFRRGDARAQRHAALGGALRSMVDGCFGRGSRCGRPSAARANADAVLAQQRFRVRRSRTDISRASPRPPSKVSSIAKASPDFGRISTSSNKRPACCGRASARVFSSAGAPSA